MTALTAVVARLFFSETATPEIYTLSLHDALPILLIEKGKTHWVKLPRSVPELVVLSPRYHLRPMIPMFRNGENFNLRSEEHTSELQSQSNLVCRLLLEKKKTKLQIAVSARTTRTR